MTLQDVINHLMEIKRDYPNLENEEVIVCVRGFNCRSIKRVDVEMSIAQKQGMKIVIDV